jgi:uncharacterized protein (TIGR04255 family)
VRFQAAMNKDEVFATLLNELIKEFPKFKLSNIPQQLRKEKDFLYAVEGTLSNADYSIGIGSNVISFNCVNGYKGWGRFFEIIRKTIDRIAGLKVVANYERIGIRFINFFKEVEHITQHLHFQIDFGNKSEYSTEQTVFSTKITKDKISHTLNISDKNTYNGTYGSIIDIDTSTNEIKKQNLKELFELIEELRFEEKKLFFSLLKNEFLEKFKPEYA